MAPPSEPSGNLTAGEWSKVFYAWGAFVVRYLLFTTAPSIEARWYGTITAGLAIPRGPFQSGDEFSVPVVGYSDLWLMAAQDCDYRLIPQDYRPLPDSGGEF